MFTYKPLAITHDVTLDAYITDKFLEYIQTKVIPSLIDEGSCSWTMSHFIDLMKYNKLLKMLGYVYFRLPSYGLFLNHGA